LVVSEHNSIGQTENSIKDAKDDHLFVDQFVDAAFPMNQQSREDKQVGICHSACVRHCHPARSSSTLQRITTNTTRCQI